MGGPASEPVAVLCAAGSFTLSLGFYLKLLFSVPAHWGVPYKNRLARHLSRSLQLETLDAVFSLATCVLLVLETYSFGTDYNFIVVSFSLEMVFNNFFFGNFLLNLYLAVDKLAHLVSLQAMVDIVTVFPSYTILFVQDGWRISDGGFADAYLGLKITRVIRVSRLLVAISFFVPEASLAFDNSRQILLLRSQLIRWSLKIVVVIFTLAGLTNFLVELQDADWGTGHGNMPFHDALYFVIVSFSTVGYGDISPVTPLSRIVISGLILMLFLCAPVVTNAMYEAARLTPKHGGRLSKSRGTGHIVVGCDASCLRVVSVLLRDLLAADSMAYHHAHVVIVVPQEPTLAWDALLCLQPSFTVTYLNGDLSSAEDLRRARVGDARACFVLTDRLATDTEVQDKTALIRALCANQASPPGGGSVLCLVTHGKTKRRLVRLGMPVASVVCYDEVMEGLVTHACLTPGFSTIFTNLLSSMPEAKYLLNAKAVEQEMSRGPESTVVFETEMEYLRSLRRVTIRFRLGAFAGECVGDVAIELHKKCNCTLFALIRAICSGGHTRGASCRGDGRGHRRALVHPYYGAVLNHDDVGVFIAESHEEADLIARYCNGRRPSEKSAGPHGRSRSAPKTEGTPNEQPADRQQKMQQQQQQQQQQPQQGTPGGGDRSERSEQTPVWSKLRGDGPEGGHVATTMISPLGECLVGTSPGVVLVIAKSLSFVLGVVFSLCEAGADLVNGSEPSVVSVLCSPACWKPAVDEPAERELAERFPSARLIKQEYECQGLLEAGADKADLVCVVASRPQEYVGGGGSGGAGLGGSSGRGGLGLGDPSGRGQRSDVWALGVAVDVLSLVPESTRVVVTFDDSTSAEKHQVVSAHVRRRTDREARRRELAVEVGGEKKGEETCEEDEQELGVGMATAVNGTKKSVCAAAVDGDAAFSHCTSWHKIARQRARRGARKWTGMLEEENSFSSGHSEEAGVGGGGVYFDDTRGVVREGFDDYFATMSGYVSGDVVIGNAAELLLLQTMLASDIQSLMSDVLNLVSRIPIEALWPQHHHPPETRSTAAGKGRNGSTRRRRPETYGEAYRSLLQDHDLLVLGLHRPPIRNNSSRQDRAAGHCPGGSRYVAISCPSASFALRDSDCLFVLQQPGEAGSATTGVNRPEIAFSSVSAPHCGTAVATATITAATATIAAAAAASTVGAAAVAAAAAANEEAVALEMNTPKSLLEIDDEPGAEALRISGTGRKSTSPLPPLLPKSSTFDGDGCGAEDSDEGALAAAAADGPFSASQVEASHALEQSGIQSRR